MSSSTSRTLGLLALTLLCLSGVAAADTFSGTYAGKDSNGQNVLQLTQSGARVTGTFTVGTTQLTITGTVVHGAVEGTAVLDGMPVSFAVVLRTEDGHLVGYVTERDEEGRPDPQTTERIVFERAGAPAGAAKAPASKAPASKAPAPGLDRDDLNSIAGRVKTNFKAGNAGAVLAAGTPPLTRGSVTAFAEVLRLTFGVELTEAEYADTAAVFVAYYQAGDPQTRAMLAAGWQQILAELTKATGAAKQQALDEVKSVLAQQFASGAQAGIPWAIAMNATIQKRAQTVATMKTPVPDYARKAALHTQMSEADLDASLEMLYFMWVAAGRDASVVTPDAVAAIRARIVQNFATFPAQVQLVFANAQQVYASLRGQWAQASAAQRAQMAQQFAVSLDQLGLTVPGASNDRISASGAWSDMNGKSHGEWAGEMVQGLAGARHHSSW
ncbi:MAG: hypothetical protein K8W52_26605 [Deltaproteobacteria bacterium]|nr:hypothetical protein [Deltaproteobacteria bacterium]